MKVPFKYKVKGEFKLVRCKAITNELGERVPGPVVEETPWSNNLLTLTYFNNALTVGALRVRGIVVGAGTAAPSEGQSALISYIAQTTTRQNFGAVLNTTESPRSVVREWRYRFGEGVATGNIAEVGMIDTGSTGTITSATPVSSRARVLDPHGEPTVITVLSDEFLDVIWRFTVYVPEDLTGTTFITIDGEPVEYSYVLRAIGMAPNAGVTAWWNGETIGVMPSIGTDVGSAQFNPVVTTETALRAYDNDISDEGSTFVGVFTAETYTPNSKNRTFRMTWPLNNGNIATRSVFINSSLNNGYVYMMGRFHLLLDKPITKVNTKTLMLQLNIALANVVD